MQRDPVKEENLKDCMQKRTPTIVPLDNHTGIRSTSASTKAVSAARSNMPMSPMVPLTTQSSAPLGWNESRKVPKACRLGIKLMD